MVNLKVHEIVNKNYLGGDDILRERKKKRVEFKQLDIQRSGKKYSIRGKSKCQRPKMDMFFNMNEKKKGKGVAGTKNEARNVSI